MTRYQFRTAKRPAATASTSASYDSLILPLGGRQRPVVPLHLIDVDPAVVDRHGDVDAPVALARASTRGPLVAPAEEHGHDGFDVLTRTADQGARHGTTSHEADAWCPALVKWVRCRPELPPPERGPSAGCANRQMTGSAGD
jgi:hypothetical protein